MRPSIKRIPKRTRSRSFSTFSNSSDTEYSSPKKKARVLDEGPGKRQDYNLVELFCHHLRDSCDYESNKGSQRINSRDQDVTRTIQEIFDSVKTRVKNDIHEEGRKVLQVELYSKWLDGVSFILTAIESILGAKKSGTRRRRVPKFGRLCFTSLYQLVDIFVEEVNAHQDGWSYRFPAGPVETDHLVMSLAEESNDSSTDARSEEAVMAAEETFSWLDQLLLSALRRYRSECNQSMMADSIGRMEESLAKSCCLLSEQTGFGATEDMGFRLLVLSRKSMIQWKKEFDTPI